MCNCDIVAISVRLTTPFPIGCYFSGAACCDRCFITMASFDKAIYNRFLKLRNTSWWSQ